MPFEPDEDLIERKERRAQVTLDRTLARVRTALRAARVPGGRGGVAAVALAVLVADLAVIGARRPAPLALVPARAAPASPGAHASLPAVSPLKGKGPFVVYAFEDGGTDHVQVFATDLGGEQDLGTYPTLFLGLFPGFVTDFAGTQGQAGGTVVPIGTAQETVDATQATRLWLLRKGGSAQQFLSTFDFVSAYALNREGNALALSRRSVISPARGSFLWLYPLEPRSARRIGSLRRPGGNGPNEQLRPVGWDAANKSIFAVPYCDQCGEDYLRGLFVVSALDGSITQVPAAGDKSIGQPSLSADGSRLAYEDSPERNGCIRHCGPRRLMVVDTTRGTVRELARSSDLAFDFPVISGDGKLVAYATGRNREIEWRSAETGRVLGSIDLLPTQDVAPVAWLNDTELIVTGQSSSARPDGPSEGDIFRVTRVPGPSGDSAHLELIASQPTAVTFLGWLR
ncbi:MAG: hypothetical protein ABR548_15865 [Actinomycetota bacterium]|nr:hypothetical protein [Actinomycetota bacterium]